MSITLTRDDTSATIELGRDLVWTDRHDWSPVVDSEERTVTGGLVVEPWVRDGGRPITLASDSNDFGLLRRATVETLDAWAGEAGLEMVLDFHGEVHDVMFRHNDSAAVSAVAAFNAGAPTPFDWMVLTLRLRTL